MIIQYLTEELFLVSITKYIVFIAVLILLYCSEALTQTKFADTRAAKAFKAENYELALEEFNKLASSNPSNSLILRYLAITLRMRGEYEQAIQVFNKALKITPNNPATFYHLGVTQYLAQQFEFANSSFQQVVELTPESEYAQLGKQYLTAIRDELDLIAKRQNVRAWNLYAQVGLGYDDNVSALPDIPGYTNTNLGSGSGNGYASLRGYFLRGHDQWLGTAEVSGYFSGYMEDDFQSLDSGTYSGSLALQNTGFISDLPYILEAKYLYQHVDIDRNVSYSRSNIASLMGKLFWGSNYSTNLVYKFSDDDFDYEGPDPNYTSRDGKEHKLAFIASFYTSDGLKNIDLGASYSTNEAKGVNFDADVYRLFVEGEIPLIWDFRGALKVSYGNDNYPNFSGPVDRKTDILGLELSFTRWIGSHLFLSVDFGLHKEDSNYDVLSYDRKIAGFNLGFSY